MSEQEKMYIGADKMLWCETITFEGWPDFIEFLNGYMYNIHSISMFYGPGSRMTVHVLRVQHEPESERPEIIGRELLPINPNRHVITVFNESDKPRDYQVGLL